MLAWRQSTWSKFSMKEQPRCWPLYSSHDEVWEVDLNATVPNSKACCCHVRIRWMIISSQYWQLHGVYTTEENTAAEVDDVNVNTLLSHSLFPSLWILVDLRDIWGRASSSSSSHEYAALHWHLSSEQLLSLCYANPVPPVTEWRCKQRPVFISLWLSDQHFTLLPSLSFTLFAAIFNYTLKTEWVLWTQVPNMSLYYWLQASPAARSFYLPSQGHCCVGWQRMERVQRKQGGEDWWRSLEQSW